MIPFQYHQTHSRTFLAANSALARFDHDLFRLRFSYVIHFSSPVTIGFKNGSNSFRFSCASQMLIRSKNFFPSTPVAPKHPAFLESNLLQMVPNGFMVLTQFLDNRANAHMPVYLDDFDDFIGFYDDWPTSTGRYRSNQRCAVRIVTVSDP